jgi:amino acid permease
MIQRIQSLYLSFSALIALLFLGGNMISFSEASGNIIGITIKGIFRYSEEYAPENIGRLLPLIIPVLMTALFSIVIVFLFRNRKLQLKLTAVLLGLSAVIIAITAVYTVYIIRKYDSDIIWSLKMLLPLLIPVCLFLAYRGIKKDEDLVKSYDRLR